MGKVLVSYDLRQPGRNYDGLFEHLKSYSGWCQTLESVWHVSTDRTAAQVRDAAKQHIDVNDQIYAVEVSGKAAAWFGLPAKISEWLKTP